MQNHKIVLGQMTMTNSDILADVKMESTINPSTDLVLGGVCCRELKFSFNKNNTSPGKIKYFVDQNPFTYYFNDVLICTFYPYKMEENDTIITVTSYDSMSLFDVNVDSWLNSLTFPMSVDDMITSLCTECGVKAEKYDSSLGSSLVIQDNITSTNLTGRQVLSWLAQTIGCYAYMNKFSKLILKKFGSSSGFNFRTSNNCNVKKVTIAKFETSPIDKLQIKQAEDDIGVISGKGTNTMVIENNPLLYASTTSELQTYADGMLDYVKDIVYVPVVVESYDYADIPLGQYFTIDMSTKAICMSISQSASGFIYKCTGNQLRENQVNQQNMQLNALRGKTNELKRTIDETSSKLTSVSTSVENLNNTVGDLNTTVGDLSNSVTTVTTQVSEIKQTADTISSKVSTVKQDMDTLKTDTDTKLSEMSSEITQTSTEINSKVTAVKTDLDNLSNSVDTRFTEINQTAESITSTVSGLEGEVNTVKQSLDGVVYESSLADGTTTINGGCITTGTINADRINMTGAITWNDLSTSVQNTINDSGGGLTTSEVKTLITDQLVSSPNIQGADYWSEDKKTHMDLLDATSVSAGIGGGIEVKGGSTQIFKACRSATLNVTLSSYSNDFLQVTSTGSIRPLGDWDFSSATVTGLSSSGSGSGSTTVVAVFG